MIILLVAFAQAALAILLVRENFSALHFFHPQAPVLIGIFLAGVLIKPLGGFIYTWFQLDATSIGSALQPWRLITYQFLHDPGYIFHIFINMLGLFFLVPTL